MNLSLLKKDIKIVLFGHLLNPLWKSKQARRTLRGAVSLSAVCEYLQKYRNFIEQITEDNTDNNIHESEKIFTIWFQGEENAPAIVKSCLSSIKNNCEQETHILDSSSISTWITLPDYILQKYKNGKMRSAHFADICRVELLYRYGGVWFDSTCFVTGSIPQSILDEDFFVFLGGEKIFGSYAFIQNCFIRARKSNFLIKAWRDAIFEYWKNENCVADYFVHQIIFKMVVENNKMAAACFAKMPKVVQDPTHALWPHKNEPYDKENFDKLCSGSFFQKTEYKSQSAINPKNGSIAYFVVNHGQS